MGEIPRAGGWHRIAVKMGYTPTPALLARVEARQRERYTAGVVSQARQDGPPAITPTDTQSLMEKMDEVMDMILESRNRRNVLAPPRPIEPTPPTNPKPVVRNRMGKGGVQLS